MKKSIIFDIVTNLEQDIYKNNTDLIKVAIESGGNVNYTNGQNYSALTILPYCEVSKRIKMRVAKLLIENGADVNVGQSCLYGALSENETKLVEYFIECGADINNEDCNLTKEQFVIDKDLLYHVLEHQPYEFGNLKNLISRYYDEEDIKSDFPDLYDNEELGLL